MKQEHQLRKSTPAPTAPSSQIETTWCITNMISGIYRHIDDFEKHNSRLCSITDRIVYIERGTGKEDEKFLKRSNSVTDELDFILTRLQKLSDTYLQELNTLDGFIGSDNGQL